MPPSLELPRTGRDRVGLPRVQTPKRVATRGHQKQAPRLLPGRKDIKPSEMSSGTSRVIAMVRSATDTAWREVSL